MLIMSHTYLVSKVYLRINYLCSENIIVCCTFLFKYFLDILWRLSRIYSFYGQLETYILKGYMYTFSIFKYLFLIDKHLIE